MRKQKKNNFLIITLVLLLFIPISYSFSGNRIGSDVYVEGNSPGKLTNKELINVQVNIYTENPCGINRYTSGGYDAPDYGTSAGLCRICDGAGNEINVPSGQDSNDDCNGIDCSGYYVATGTEGAYSSQIESCYERANEPASTHNCNGNGVCRTAAQDCPGNPADTFQYSCGECKYIDTSNCAGTTLGACTNYNLPTACGVCKGCQSGYCQNQATNTGDNLFGCIGSNKYCSLVRNNLGCKTCNGWYNGWSCYYIGNYGQSCTSVCASHGGTNGYFKDPGCVACRHFVGSQQTCTRNAMAGMPGYGTGTGGGGAQLTQCWEFMPGNTPNHASSSPLIRSVCRCSQ
ncbi:MAG: hypothetical protein U9O94_07200 [Nanoarchaeota archaeon]|nr:hypothetical protein [Nanoarchaeota archaeon]